MKKHLISIIAAASLAPLLVAAQNFSKINDLPVRNSPVGTDSIPAQDAAGTTWRIQFSKFTGTGGAGSGLPDMTGNANKILTNNGTIASWTATPTITLTNATGLPLATGISGFATGATAFLGTGGATSANLRTLITDEVGTGAAYFLGGALGAPTITLTNATGTPTSIGLANGTGLPASGISSGTIAQARLGTGSTGTGSNFLADDQTYKAIAGGGDALQSLGLGQFASTLSSAFATVISDETGTGFVVLNGSPAFTGSPFLGTSPTAVKFGTTGTAGGGFIDLNTQSSTPANPGAGSVRLYSDAAGQFSLKTSSNSFVLTLNTAGITASRTYTAANKTGQVLVGDDLNLAAGTVLTVGEHYYDTVGANRTFTFTGTPVAGGNATILRANVTTPVTVTFPASVRVASSSPTPITSLNLPVGLQMLSWTYSNGTWTLLDTVADTSGLVPETRLVAGHPLSSDVVIAEADLVFSDLTAGNATTGRHGFLPKLDGNNTHFLDGTGAFVGIPGSSIPSGTGFFHITSGVQDGAAVGETGTDTVVRSTLPTIAGLIDNAALTLSGVLSTNITSDQNNFTHASLATAFSVRLDASATDRTITGIAGGTTGRVLLFTNVSSTANITLADQSTSSTSTNRFAFGGSDFIITPSRTALVRYDGNTSRWRLIGGAALVGDSAAPGNFKFYGTNAAGVKGYQDLAPDTVNVLAGDGAGGIGDTGIPSGELLTASTISELPDYSIALSQLNFTDTNLTTVLSGSTYTLVPGHNYYGDITGSKTFAFSPALTSADAPITVRFHVTGAGTWTVPTLIRDGATGATTTVTVSSTGYFSATFFKTGAGDLRMIDDLPQLMPVAIGIAASDETTALTTGTAKATFRMPYAMTLTGVRATLTTAQATGSAFTVDIKEAGTTILSTKITVDNTEKTSVNASVAPVISDTALADDGEITVDIDQIGTSGATGLKIWLIGGR